MLITITLFKYTSTYQTYFKVLSAFLMYFVGRLYYDRIRECSEALACSSYLVVYLNFFYRIGQYGLKFRNVVSADGDLYYYDTDMAFAMILAMIFIAMFAKNSVLKLATIMMICPYMVFYSDAGIQKVLMLVSYTIILIYISELIFRKRKLSNILLIVVI